MARTALKRRRGIKSLPPESIENHGVVGDLRTVALVDMNGTIDFMCWPRFDSPSIFASLLDADRGGAFELTPDLRDIRRRQLYLPDTNVLLTRFLSAEGAAEISDFMPVADGPQRLIRRVKAIRNPVRFRMRCLPEFDYGRSKHALHAETRSVVFTPAKKDLPALRLWSTVPLKITDRAATATFELKPDESAAFVLEEAHEDAAALDADYVASAFKATLNYWREWLGRSQYHGRWRDTVNRSALVLKLLTSQEHGSIVAAATFGLPETAGGKRNWDYRYSWMRDAAFTIYAFLRLGFTSEASAFMRWLSRVASSCGGQGDLRVMYNVDGQSNLEEVELKHFKGYQNSRPVRIGNAASSQLQLDIYGAVMDAVYLSDKYGEQLPFRGWAGVCRSMEWVLKHWREPDHGIWEIRGKKRPTLHSRLMCWVALDRAIRLSRKRSLPAPLLRWSKGRDDMYHSIHADFWNEELQSFVQSKGSKEIDASCLLMPLVRFISPTDPRFLSTLQAVEENLMDDSLVYRYANDTGFDGLEGVEGTFNMCSFWYVECVARSGDLKKARFYFEKMLGYANHLGLFAEETGMSGEPLGNFPQAFTHLSLISAAYYLDKALSAQA
jgi:GH15 family glucan-1,4-alpha-glucosidase